MKPLDVIIKQEPVYLGSWEQEKFEGLASSFRFEKYHPEYKNINILFAYYGNFSEGGDAFVLFEKYGKLFEVNVTHCSCYGIEGDFEPEETTLQALMARLIDGNMGASFGSNDYANELKEFIGIE